jgi:hypothetical protein
MDRSLGRLPSDMNVKCKRTTAPNKEEDDCSQHRRGQQQPTKKRTTPVNKEEDNTSKQRRGQQQPTKKTHFSSASAKPS